MKLADFTYNLPEDLIAKHPPENRVDSKLLVTKHIESSDLSNKPINIGIQHKSFKDIVKLFNPGDLLVLNNTKVIPARFYGQKPTGAKIEFLLERVLDNNQALCYIKANKPPKPETVINLNINHSDADLNNIYSITVIEKRDNLYLIKLNNRQSWYEILDQVGSLPLPPYINRKLVDSDSNRYQTVFAEQLGAVAVPTAGLHFDQKLLDLLKANGVKIRYVTLHVGAGTFAPVRVDNIKEHKMHSERYSIDIELINEILEIKEKNKKTNTKINKIIACGTTSLRCLESVFRDIDIDKSNDTNSRHCEELSDVAIQNESTRFLPTSQACGRNDVKTSNKTISGETDIFIYPGFEFKAVDSLITNFHLPESTLMMLVSAFSGYDEIKYIYQQAIDNKYRFFSYGDAMWLDRCLACS